MSNLTYAEKLKDPRWQKKRLKVFERDNWRCVYCNDENLTLHIHHERYEGNNPWDTPDEYLKTVCSPCHEFLEIVKETDPNVSVTVLTKIESEITKGNYLFGFVLQSDGETLVSLAARQNGKWTVLPFLSSQHKIFIQQFLESA